MKKIIYIALVIFSIGCSMDAVNVDIPEVDPKLSVSCFISSETDTIKVAVFWSKPIFSNVERPGRPEDALVTISNGTQTSTLIYNPITQQYEIPTSDFPLTTSAQYYLRVKASDGTEVYASTAIPGIAPSVFSQEIEYGEYDGFGFEGNKFYRAKTTLNDLTSNFERYRVMYYESEDYGNGSFDSYRGETFLTDENLNSGKIYTEFVTDYYMFGGDAKLKTVVVLASEEYYRFHFTAYNQFDGDPFSEPTLIYSNINGGLGVFAGYSSITIEQDLLPQ